MNPVDAAYPTPSSEAVTRVMRANRKTGSRPETALRQALFQMGLRYRKNPAVRTKAGVVRPDIVFPRPRVAVFVDGCFWHSCPLHGNVPRANRDYWGPKLRRNRERDAVTSAALDEQGWVVLRVWEHEPVEDAARRIEGVVRSRA